MPQASHLGPVPQQSADSNINRLPKQDFWTQESPQLLRRLFLLVSPTTLTTPSVVVSTNI